LPLYAALGAIALWGTLAALDAIARVALGLDRRAKTPVSGADA
jgi:hypothetical protein